MSRFEVSPGLFWKEKNMIPPKGATTEATMDWVSSQKKNIHSEKKRSLADFYVSVLGVGTYLGSYDEVTDKLY